MAALKVSMRAGPPPTRENVTALRLKRILGRAAALVAALIALAKPVYAESISPRRLLEVVDLGNPVVSVDGRNVAFRAEYASVERNTYDTVWYVQSVGGTAPPRRVAEGGVPLREYSTGVVLPSPAVWSPDGRWIYYRAQLDGAIAVWRAAVDGSGAAPVTFDPADVRSFALVDDGRTLKYSVGATRDEVLAVEQSGYDRGVRIDDSIVISAGLLRSSRVEGHPSTQRFVGDWFTTGPLLADMGSHWKTVDLATFAVTDLHSAGTPPRSLEPADLQPGIAKPWKLALNERDGRVAILTRVGETPGVLHKPDVELAVLATRRSRTPVTCLAELCTKKAITDLQWRPGTDEVLFTTVDNDRGGAQSIFGWNVVTGAVRPVVVSEGLVSGGQRYWDVPCSASLDHLVCIAAEADRPPRLEAISLTTGERRRLFQPNEGLEADIAATVPVRLLSWTDERGRLFTGYLFRAVRTPTENPPPLFVNFYHCHGFLRGGVGDEWPLASLAEHGITSVCINAIPEYRTDFVERYDQGRLAVEGLVKYLAARGEIDPSRVGMGALSYGSDVTLWTAVYSNVLAAASVSSPSVNEVYYLFNSLRRNFHTGLAQMWDLGSPDEARERWEAISPTYHLDEINVPILFQMPEQEYRLILEYALPLVRRRQADIYAFPDEAHNKFQPRHKLAAYIRNVDWFRFWLQDNYEDPDPLKADQYREWRAMRAEMSIRREAGG